MGLPGEQRKLSICEEDYVISTTQEKETCSCSEIDVICNTNEWQPVDESLKSVFDTGFRNCVVLGTLFY